MGKRQKFLLFFGILAAEFFLSAGIIFSQATLNIPQTQGPCCYCSGPFGYICEYLSPYGSCAAFAQSKGLTPSDCQSTLCNSYNKCPGYIETQSSNPLRLKLNIAIPGLEEFSQGEGVELNNESFGKYIGGLYRFFIGIAGILAVFMMMFGGVQWLFSSGNSEKVTKAQETILGAVVGLILALGSYTILYTINPRLVKFSPLGVSLITQQSDECPQNEPVYSIRDYLQNFIISGQIDISSNCSDPRLTNGTLAKLASITLINSNERLVITSAYRDIEKQKQLYECYQKSTLGGTCPVGCESCNVAAKPECTAPHTTGKALDVCIQIGDRDTCLYIDSIYNNATPASYPLLSADQKRLQEIMQAAGFSRYCGEWWHFESEPMSTACPPGVY